MGIGNWIFLAYPDTANNYLLTTAKLGNGAWVGTQVVEIQGQPIKISINDGPGMTFAPTGAPYQGTLYIAYTLAGTSPNIEIISSTDGLEWTKIMTQYLLPVIAYSPAPAYNTANSTLFIAYNNGGGDLNIISSKDGGATWSQPQVVGGDPQNPMHLGSGPAMQYTPGAQGTLGTLCIAFRAQIGNNLFVTTSTDGGATWTNPPTEYTNMALQYTPGMAYYTPDGTNLITSLVYQGYPDNNLYISSSSNGGVLWDKPKLVGGSLGSILLNSGPALAATSGIVAKLCCAFQAFDGTYLGATISENAGQTWGPGLPFHTIQNPPHVPHPFSLA